MDKDKNISTTDWHTCLNVLSRVIDDPNAALDLASIERLATLLYKQARKRRRKEADRVLPADERAARHARSQQERQENRVTDQTSVKKTIMVRVHKGEQVESKQFENSAQQTTKVRGKNKACYCCGTPYRDLHLFYHKLCPECAELNLQKRQQRVDLTGRYCLVTGGRIKIGFQTALKLLRDNATVMVTTRFAQDALLRFSSESDFNQWQDRLFIQPLDLRDLHVLTGFINYLESTWPALDILINNAAQTVWRPPEFYAPAIQQEHRLNLTTSLKERIVSSEALISSQNHLNLLDSITEQLDRHGQPLDRREQNSWNLRLHEVEARELVEVLLINTTAPCMLTAKLKPLFLRSKFPSRFIINVTGLDGQFNRVNKTFHHPHVNMSKAALNMMTRTSATDYQQDGIFINSVDTGWISLEGGFSKRESMEAQGFVPPLDEVDGAARIYDPVIMGIKSQPQSGQLFRNYLPVNW